MIHDSRKEGWSSTSTSAHALACNISSEVIAALWTLATFPDFLLGSWLRNLCRRKDSNAADVCDLTCSPCGTDLEHFRAAVHVWKWLNSKFCRNKWTHATTAHLLAAFKKKWEMIIINYTCLRLWRKSCNSPNSKVGINQTKSAHAQLIVTFFFSLLRTMENLQKQRCAVLPEMKTLSSVCSLLQKVLLSCYEKAGRY